MSDIRIETDSMGDVRIPHEAYYGAQTQRAVENFPISGSTFPPAFIRALGLIKWAGAMVNRDLGRFVAIKNCLSPAQIDALIHAAREVAEGHLDDQFPVDVFQTGSGTSTNMNVNEVIANHAIELFGGDRTAAAKPIHPNDHVNLGQSTNDVFPTAIHVAAAREIKEKLFPVLAQCEAVLGEKAKAWKDILKIGRTHLADATPMTLGQEFSGFARQLTLSRRRAERALEAVLELPLGGTAVGTGLNTHLKFASRVCELLSKETGIPFREAQNHFEAAAQRDAIVECHAQLKTIAVSLFSIANNIRILGSGPRCGFHEVVIPDLQPGSSIMPGKVNPVLCESLMQVGAAVMGNDSVIAFSGASGGQFQLNIMMPIMAEKLLESIRLLASSVTVFTERTLRSLEPDRAACEAMVEKSLALVTGLVPLLGYEQAAALAKEASATGKTIRALCRERQVLSEEQLSEALDPKRMTRSEASS